MPWPAPTEPENDAKLYIFLASKAFTLTMPTFRQGPVRFAKTALLLIVPALFAADDTLDGNVGT